MLGWRLGSISPWSTHCGRCRQQWGCSESPLPPSWGSMPRPMMLLAGAAVAGSQASPRNAQGRSRPGAGRGEWPEEDEQGWDAAKPLATTLEIQDRPVLGSRETPRQRDVQGLPWQVSDHFIRLVPARDRKGMECFLHFKPH